MRFTDATDESGVTFRHTTGASGKYHIVEGVSAGLALFDYDLDGQIDLYFLNGSHHDANPGGPAPRNALYRNQGNWRFRDVTDAAGIGDTGYGLGVTVGDYDSDGDPDLFLNNYGPNALYRNNGDGTFTEVTKQAGLDEDTQMGAGANFLDADGDGDVDVVVLNAGGRPTLLKNETASRGHWLQVTLRGPRSNRDGIGAQVRVVTPDLTLMDEVHSGRSYQSHFGSRLYFGLGPRTEISRIEVDWNGGEREVFPSTPVDRHLVLVEGQGTAPSSGCSP